MSDAPFGFNPIRVPSGINAKALAWRKEVMSLPDIRRMGDDFVVVISGKLVRCDSYDAAYALWEEAAE